MIRILKHFVETTLKYTTVFKNALSKEEMIFKEMTDNIDELFRVSLLNQILFPLIRILEVTTCV